MNLPQLLAELGTKGSSTTRENKVLDVDVSEEKTNLAEKLYYENLSKKYGLYVEEYKILEMVYQQTGTKKKFDEFYIENVKVENGHVKHLNLGGTQVSDISYLKELKNLKTLYLAETQVSDISYLKELKNLNRLSLFNTQVSDINFLKDLKNLRTLSLRNTQVNPNDPIILELRNRGVDVRI